MCDIYNKIELYDMCDIYNNNWVVHSLSDMCDIYNNNM